ncbi:MAG: 3-deoxy-D-manno-octulosonate 8-phosphate phosphatase (KDO 8-P phosphatase) [Paracoccaceae bacterium]|jgi:3-deoxy-D-manno-octulosonate 8-phosphate phosphatase (KDO 8-P phosphatase)
MILDRFSSIDTFILDVDGVLTSGTVIASSDGEMRRDFNIKDGFALQYAVKQGYHVIIISGGDNEGVRKRLRNLGITEVHTAVADKRKLLKELETKLQINLKNALYMGDDFPDLSVMRMCGIKVCPSDAAWEVQEEVDIVTKALGGKGAVREILEKVLISQDKWESTEHSVW